LDIKLKYDPKKKPDGLGPYRYIHTTCFADTSLTAHWNETKRLRSGMSGILALSPCLCVYHCLHYSIWLMSRWYRGEKYYTRQQENKASLTLVSRLTFEPSSRHYKGEDASYTNIQITTNTPLCNPTTLNTVLCLGNMTTFILLRKLVSEW